MSRRLAVFVAVIALCLGVVGPATATVEPAGSTEAATVSAPIGGSEVPHYFGPSPNWANSPLTAPAANVTIVGDGVGATATATVGANGAITDILITDPGHGYSQATTTVEITGQGAGATASVTVSDTGAVTSVTVVSGGGGYVNPTVEFVGGGGPAAPVSVGNPLVERAYATDFAPVPFAPASVAIAGSSTFSVDLGSATGGTFTLTINGAPYGPIAFDGLAGAPLPTGATVAGSVVTLASVVNAVSIDGSALTTGATGFGITGFSSPYHASVGDATGGTFVLTSDGLSTAPIAWNASVVDVQSALDAALIPATVSAGAAGSWDLTFGTDPLLLSMDGALLSTAATGFGVTVGPVDTWTADVGNAIGGTFTLAVDGGTPTDPIAWNAFAPALETALGAGVAVTGTGPWTIRFATPPTTFAIDGSGLTFPSLQPIFVVVPSPIPAGLLTAFRTWNQTTPGGSPGPSSGGAFNAYVLRPTGSPNQYTVAYDSGTLSVPLPADPAGEIATFDVSPGFPVQAGDVLAFYGSGIPVDIGTGLDQLSYPALSAPAAASTIMVGGLAFPLYPQERVYSFGGVVDSSGIDPVTKATATALGGVDSIELGDPGTGYTFPTVDIDYPDDPAGIQATAHATLDASTGAITGVVVDNPGSGYLAPPNVVIRDGTLFDPIRNGGSGATVAAVTLTITSIVLDTFGSGYLSAPTVVITDGLGGTGNGATAFADINAGAVTGITLTAPGSGYVTPGGIQKFTDGLPGLCTPAGATPPAGGCPMWSGDPLDPTTWAIPKYIPLAVPEPKLYNGIEADEYVIGLVQYRTSFSSSMPDTLVRGYVQLETPANAAVSQHFPLKNELMSGAMVDTGWYAVTPPQYLGPIIGATKNKPVRIVFYNLLPTGSDGDLFLPVDSTLMGSGMGPMDMADPIDEGVVTDEVRNPICSEYPKPDECFPDNRATLHLHGGITPWISDGTAHQWITPAGETTAWPQGVSVENVPDMNVCSGDRDGCQTFYYTNQQSARLMFYHDHSWGITRLNVYAGEAAGYLITDDTEKALVANGVIPGAADTIPLIVQDKTFVPGDAQLLLQDPTWDVARWGSKGSFWQHHVYMPAQNPGDPSGMSAYGRWMYGPWFWPPAGDTKYGPIANPYYDEACDLDDPATWTYPVDPFCEPELIPGTPNISVGMEQFNDTPIVNGVAYPTITLDPKTYRLRILSAANDRFFNLQWYVGDPTTASTSHNKMGEVIGATEVHLNPAELALAQTDPVTFPTPMAPAGPDWIAIGSEGGFLPAPTVIDGQQPTTWITDPTRFDVGNVDLHSLLLAPAERADVIVDFSRFAGQTLILYNDAPAAFPARVPSYDYYTGAPDTGAGQILPGYGPNTRTVMQVKISGNVGDPAGPAFNLTKLQNAFKHNASGTGVFESGQHPIIVGQAAYNSAYGTSFAASSNCNAPGSTLARCDGLVRVNDVSTFGFNTLTAPNAKMSLPLQPKAIHDEMNATAFDEFGRMQANLGVEAQPPTPGAQNVTLYPFVNPATELIDATNLPKQDVAYDPLTGLPVDDVTITPISSAADGTQIWRITHNGVDTHPIHFHLYDVQVLNRVTWDNIIIPTDPTELGWKDTVRISPLQDTIVALRPIIPEVPFEVPNAVRPLSPMMPIGSTAMFNNVDVQGNPTAPIVNSYVNFGWEYVYHCHILSHEEMDMMRPVSVALPPVKPDGLSVAVTGNRFTVSWNDNSINETAFVLQRSINGLTWTNVGTSLSPLTDATGTVRVANTHGVRSLRDGTSNVNTAYLYRVVAQNRIGYTGAGGAYPTMAVQSISDPIVVNEPAAPPTVAPANLTATVQTGPQVRLQWFDGGTNESGFVIERATSGGPFSQLAVAPLRNGTGNATFTDTTIQTGTTYQYRVAAVNLFGGVATLSGWSNVVDTGVNSPVPAAPSNLSATAGPNQGNKRSAVLTWTDNSLNESGFTVQRATNAAFTTGVVNTSVTSNVTTTTLTGLSKATTYYFRIRANNAVGASGWANAIQFPFVTNP